MNTFLQDCQKELLELDRFFKFAEGEWCAIDEWLIKLAPDSEHHMSTTELIDMCRDLVNAGELV